MPRTKKQFEEIREKTRAKILNTALELFAKKGYSKTSISDIATSAKISKGLAYNYFENKQNLMGEVIKVLFIEVEKMFRALENVKDPFEKIHKIIDLIFDWTIEKEHFWRLYLSLMLQEEVKEIVGKIAGNYLSEMIAEMEKIFRKMKIKNAASEAMIFAAILDGIGFHILIMRKDYPIEKMRKFLKNKYRKENFS